MKHTWMFTHRHAYISFDLTGGFGIPLGWSRKRVKTHTKETFISSVVATHIFHMSSIRATADVKQIKNPTNQLLLLIRTETINVLAFLCLRKLNLKLLITLGWFSLMLLQSFFCVSKVLGQLWRTLSRVSHRAKTWLHLGYAWPRNISN